MSKFYGVIGYVTEVESTPGVWTNQILEKTYRCDVLQNVRRWQEGEKINDDIRIDNRISLLADLYAYEHIPDIRYIIWLGTKWKVLKVEIIRPRIILTLGGVYNGT